MVDVESSVVRLGCCAALIIMLDRVQCALSRRQSAQPAARACSCGADFPIFYGIKIVVTLAVLSPPRVPTPAPTQCQGLLRLLSMRFLATPKVLSPSPVIAPPEPLHVLFICRLAHRLIPLARTPFFCGERTAPSAVLPIFPRLKIFSALPLFRTEQSQCAG